MAVISRREVIGCAVAVSALGFDALARAESPAAVFASTASNPQLALILIDPRFDDARKMARRFAQPHAEVIELPRDVLELWHARLAPALSATSRVSDAAFAGVTTERGFFLLRTLAADQRLSVLSSTVHAAGLQGEPLVSWVIGQRG